MRRLFTGTEKSASQLFAGPAAQPATFLPKAGSAKKPVISRPADLSVSRMYIRKPAPASKRRSGP
jgi:hypothetical protein